jgi:hypothetical protein
VLPKIAVRADGGPGLRHDTRVLGVSPLTFAENDNALAISQPCGQDQSIRLTSSANADNRLADLGFTLSNDMYIDSITVCYGISNALNHITGFYLTSMTVPTTFTVPHHAPAFPAQVGARCYTSAVPHVPVPDRDRLLARAGRRGVAAGLRRDGAARPDAVSGPAAGR